MNPLRAIETPEYELLSLQYDLLFNFGADDMAPDATGLATEVLPPVRDQLLRLGETAPDEQQIEHAVAAIDEAIATGGWKTHADARAVVT